MVDRRHLRRKPRGPSARLRLNPFRTYVRKRASGGRAGPTTAVTPYPARYGIWASVTRKTLNATYGSTPFGTAEAVDVTDRASLLHRVGGAPDFLEDRVGSIEVGKDADIAVWDRNMYSVPVDDLRNLRWRADAVPRQSRLTAAERNGELEIEN